MTLNANLFIVIRLLRQRTIPYTPPEVLTKTNFMRYNKTTSAVSVNSEPRLCYIDIHLIFFILTLNNITKVAERHSILRKETPTVKAGICKYVN